MGKPRQYPKGTTVRCRAVFTDPTTQTYLTNAVRAGAMSLPVESGGASGALLPAGAQLVVGGDSTDLVTVGTGGATQTAIPLAAPLANDHSPGDPVSMLLDPTSVAFETHDPAGATVTYTAGQVTREQYGVYHVDVVPTLAGTWYYEATGAGNVTAQNNDAFIVAASPF